MMRKFGVVLAAILLSLPTAGQAQNDLGEIVVTAQRRSGDYYSDEQTVIGLRRDADSAVQAIWITSDSRAESMRKSEIHAMLLAALQRAGAAGVQLVMGDFELVTVTAANYRDLVFLPGNRPDTSKIALFVKAKLAGSTGNAQMRIDDFVKAVPSNGRALMEKQGNLTLTIINPDQYRDEVVKLVAENAKRYASYFGPEYGVEVGGLNEQLAWTQVSNTQVFLYIPYRFSIKPK
ncbi:MAG: TonB-dependent receptor [Novosphingobium sp.]